MAADEVSPHAYAPILSSGTVCAYFDFLFCCVKVISIVSCLLCCIVLCCGQVQHLQYFIYAKVEQVDRLNQPYSLSDNLDSHLNTTRQTQRPLARR